MNSPYSWTWEHSKQMAKICPLSIPCGADAMPWVETGGDHTLIFCDAPFESGHEFFASFRIGYGAPPQAVTDFSKDLDMLSDRF